jgi:hypothetical protein
MGFRIALGAARCADGLKHKNGSVRELCSRTLARLERLRLLSSRILVELPAESSERERIGDAVAEFLTHNEKLENGDTLIVVQAFLPTWRSLNYLGPAGIGRICAEGLVVDSEGRIAEALESDLWQYR